jgi:hypothetical protein
MVEIVYPQEKKRIDNLTEWDPSFRPGHPSAAAGQHHITEHTNIVINS